MKAKDLLYFVDIAANPSESARDRVDAVKEIKKDFTARGIDWKKACGGEMYPIPAMKKVREFIERGCR